MSKCLDKRDKMITILEIAEEKLYEAKKKVTCCRSPAEKVVSIVKRSVNCCENEKKIRASSTLD